MQAERACIAETLIIKLNRQSGEFFADGGIFSFKTVIPSSLEVQLAQLNRLAVNCREKS